MLDIKFVRENPDLVDKSCESRQNAHWDREKFFELDEERRSVIAEVESLQAERNAVSKQIGLLMREGKKEEAEAAKEQVAANKDRIAELDQRRGEVEEELTALVAAIPNIPDASVPYGKDDSDNPEVRKWGEPTQFDFEPKAHWDLGHELGMIDFDRGVKLAGTRFYLLGGMGARMERALINFMIDTHNQAGFKEWWPPVITNQDSLFGTGQLPKFEEDLYHVQPDLYLIPTAEVQLTNIHRDEILDASQLPLLYTAFTPCFRLSPWFRKPRRSFSFWVFLITWLLSALVTLASLHASAMTLKFGSQAITHTRRFLLALTAGISRPVVQISAIRIQQSSRAPV